MHDLTMTVINDGNGDICGITYDRRVEIARMPVPGSRKKEWHKAVALARQYLKTRSVQTGIKDQFIAAQEIEDYYQNHIHEMAGVENAPV
jgi:hypothetical protein